jgi:DNA-binding transcriptional ArsR family regulator
MKDINNIMLNPVRMRIIQVLSERKSMTTTELCKEMEDIPRTTLYRHVRILLDNNILLIVSEQKIRGSLERMLALNTKEMVSNNTLDNAAQNAFAFLMNRYARFQNYFNGKSPDPAKDKIFLNNTILMMTDNEFDQFLSELRGLLVKYNFEISEGRKTRDISIVSAPGEVKS